MSQESSAMQTSSKTERYVVLEGKIEDEGVVILA